jgi:hypothetical protein
MRMILTLLIALLTFGAAFAQFTPVTEKEYNSALEKARTKTEKLPKRVKTVRKEYADAKLVNTTSTIEEYVSDDKGRWMQTIEEGGTKTISERISVGKSLFERSNGGDWKKSRNIDSGATPEMSIVASGPEIKTITCHEPLVTPYELGGVPVTFYFSLEVLEMKGELSFIENKDWVNKDSMIILSQITVSNIVPTNIYSADNVSYEYNPGDLKIEAPIK